MNSIMRSIDGVSYDIAPKHYRRPTSARADSNRIRQYPRYAGEMEMEME